MLLSPIKDICQRAMQFSKILAVFVNLSLLPQTLFPDYNTLIFSYPENQPFHFARDSKVSWDVGLEVFKIAGHPTVPWCPLLDSSLCAHL